MLTRRQIEVLQALVDWSGQREAGRHLGITVATMRNHVLGIRERLGARSLPQAAAIAWARGLIR